MKVSLEFGNHIKKMFRKYFGCTDAWDSLLGPELAKEPFWIVAPDQATKSIAYKLNFWNFCHVFLLIILWFLLFVTTFTVKWSNLDQRINSWKYQQWEEDQTFLTWVMNANSPSILRKATLQDHNKQPSCWNPLEPSGLKRCQFERWGTGMKWDQASSKKILPLDPKTMKNEGFIYTPKIWVITPKNEGWGSLYIFCFAGSSWRSASKVLYRRPKRDPTECGDGPGDGPAICLADTCESYDTGPSVGYFVCSMRSRVHHAYTMTSWNNMQLSKDHGLIGIYWLGNKIALETLETVIF